MNVRSVLSKARKIMNNDGKHWVRGYFKIRREGEYAYCSLGGIREALKQEGLRWDRGEGKKWYRRAIRRLATTIDPKWENKAKPILIYYSSQIQKEAALDGAAESTIMNWNDISAEDWAEVESVFKK